MSEEMYSVSDNAHVKIKKSMLRDIDDFIDGHSEKDVFITTINGSSNVEGKNYVYGRSINYATFIPAEGYNKFRIERRYNGELEADISGEFTEITLDNGDKIMALDMEFDKLKDGTYIEVYCLKEYDDFNTERNNHWEECERISSERVFKNLSKREA